jgi:hypothetical protein
MKKSPRSRFERAVLDWLWWNTLPYEGWTWYAGEPVPEGAVPCPWWAHPLAWVHRAIDAYFDWRKKGGPWS